MQQHTGKQPSNPTTTATTNTSTSSLSLPISSKSKFILISMAVIFTLSLLSLILYFSLSSASHHHNDNHLKPSMVFIPPQIHQACQSTRYPDTCESSLLQSDHLPPNPTPLQIIQSSLFVSIQNLNTATSMVMSIIDSSLGSPNLTMAANSCMEVLGNSKYRHSLTEDALPNGKIKDARAWMSAALSFEYGCWSGLKYVNDTDQVNHTMSFLNSLIGFTSNALSMMVSYDAYGNETDKWCPPRTERTGFWEGMGSGGGGVSGLGFKGGVPELMADVTVCSEGCNFKAVQDAVDMAPVNLTMRNFVIRIKEGVYEETVRVSLEKTNIVFVGDGMGKTIITGSMNVGQPGISTYNSATVGVIGDGFMASGLTIQNTAGPDAHQAVAFRSASDLSIIENCEFIGSQDTLYAHSLRQFYKSCRIQGNVDFIFGNSASLFQDCTILISPRQVNPEKGEDNTVTAHGRADPAQSTGFVFQNCVINGTQEYMVLYYGNPKVHNNFLGRPWKEYSRTVLIHCYIEAVIAPQGWMPWIGDFALETLYYGEFENSGPGSNVSQRVSWSSQIPTEHVFTYSVQSFIQGDEWIPTSN